MPARINCKRRDWRDKHDGELDSRNESGRRGPGYSANASNQRPLPYGASVLAAVRPTRPTLPHALQMHYNVMHYGITTLGASPGRTGHGARTYCAQIGSQTIRSRASCSA